LVDSSGNSYLIDFGCAESSRKPSGCKSDTGLNIPYLSPQVSQKDMPAASDDMWALGLVLTEVVTGRHIIYRMGRHDIPFYTQPDSLQKALDETVTQGGPILGRIAKRLLDTDARKRATASEVQTMFGSMASQLSMSCPAGPNYGGSKSVAPSPSTLPSTTTVQGYSSSASGVSIAPGQEVIYQASSHNASYKGTVIGRAAGNRAWLIKLTGGGTKEVPDTELWRLTPKGSEAPAISQTPAIPQTFAGFSATGDVAPATMSALSGTSTTITTTKTSIANWRAQ